MIVSAPGQNDLTNRLAIGVISVVTFDKSFIFPNNIGIAFELSRIFVSNKRSIAFRLNASAPKPYTVSVGKETNFPLFNKLIALLIDSSMLAEIISVLIIGSSI